MELTKAALDVLVAQELAKPQPAVYRQAEPRVGAAPYATLWLGQGADVATTVVALSQGTAVEGNPIFGAHPSPARIIAVKVGVAGAMTVAMRVLGKKHPTGAKAVGYATGALGAAAAILNARYLR